MYWKQLVLKKPIWRRISDPNSSLRGKLNTNYEKRTS